MNSTLSLLGFLALMTSVPYAVVRGNRLRYAVFDATAYVFFAGLWMVLPGIAVKFEPALWFAAFVFAKLAIFFAFLYFVDAGLTPNWAGVFAGALYLVLIPHVLQWPIDGDEPYYLLVTESLVQDRDFDLRNQYAGMAESATGRPDLKPQAGDPAGRRGEQYSRTEPFFSVLLMPGYLMFGLAGAVATVAVFGGLAVRSTLMLLNEEGFSGRAALLCGAFLAAGPPIIFYATRLWPEVPAAFFFVEALRGVRSRRSARVAFSLAFLGLLKLRFLLIAVILLLVHIRRIRMRWQTAAIGAAVIVVPLLIIYALTGGWMNVHQPWELRPGAAWKYARGLFGLLLDGQAGILFQAPFFAVGIAATLGWRHLPESARAGILSSVVYLLLLIPREEWHGGWSPPLRYLVVLMPALCVAAAVLIERVPAALLVTIAIATFAIAVHGLAFPWRLFHEANGESIAGEFLSARYHADFSRMVPSFIRPNSAAIVACATAVAAGVAYLLLRSRRLIRIPATVGVAIAAVLFAGWFRAGLRPGGVVHFEDMHVRHSGGELYPRVWTVARFLYTGGWIVRPGDTIHFRYDGGESRLFFFAHAPAGLLIDGKVANVPWTRDRFTSVPVVLGRGRDHTIQGLTGEVILDRIEKQ